jgi:hypothetical protein
MSVGLATIILSFSSFSQSPSPTPSEPDNGYSVTVSTEVGGRWVDVNGSENKFRSDLNYRSGLRLFDSSILIENNRSGSKWFDSALFQGSGWGADPSGNFRANIDRDGQYRFTANIRRVGFFNNLNNHAVGQTLINYHNYDITRNLGDIDLTIFPESPTFRIRIGGSYNLQGDTYTYTSRSSEAFPVTALADSKAYDFRAGADGKLFGFNLSGTYGYRDFRNRTIYRLLTPNEGDQPGNRFILAMERTSPIDGATHFGTLSVQRTFARKFDFTAKILHSRTSMGFVWNEFDIYRTATTTQREEWSISGDANRPQTRGDLGMTWRATDKFRISNTFTYDGFNINGGNNYAQFTTSATIRRNFTITRYRRYANLLEGDYQFNDRFAVNAGYRYTHRQVRLNWVQLSQTGALTDSSSEDAENSTNTFIAGTRIKPVNNWAIYADVESGKADNVFTRAGNSDFTNFRIRSRMSFNKVAANVSFISKDNEIPSEPTTGTFPRITETRSRTFSATVDWNPRDEFSLSGGYNYLHLTSEAFIRLRFATLVEGFSQYFVRDSYFFIDATARPHKRISLYGSYRWNKDTGHGDRVIPPLGSSTILGSYPIDFKMPEFRAAIRLNRYVDWNIGYQYYDYKEKPPVNIQYGLPFQNYSAHLPYTSLRIYFGKGADR